MNIISHFNKILTKKSETFMKSYLINFVNEFNNPYSIESYKQLIIDFDDFTSNLNKEMYEELILLLDQTFMNSIIRKKSYNSRGFVTKSLLTKFGYINLKRRRYENKITKESFMFVDRFLGLNRHSRVDPFVIADLCEEASSTSYSKAGSIVSKSIGNKIKYNKDINKDIISRATARNLVLKAIDIIEEPISDKIKEVKVLNVMLDEKFVGSQFNNKFDHMIKAAVVFEDTFLEYKNRNRLTGKKVFGSVEGDLLTQVVDYIYYNYDTDKLKTINFMGDGANWIKSFSFDSSFKYHKDIVTKYGLDHFHLAQAIQHITTNKHKKSFSNILRDYIINDNQKDFITVCEAIISIDKVREETIRKKMDYIINNWKYIQATFHSINYKCSMESNISHVFADLFTSRPKSYSLKGIKGLLKLRLLKINGSDFKDIYFKALEKHNKQTKENNLINQIYINNNKTNSKYHEYLTHTCSIELNLFNNL